MKSPVYTYKKLHYLFNVLDTYTAGIMLEGWEVKSLQEFAGNLEAAFCSFKGKNLVMTNCKITPLLNHQVESVSASESRDRVLLLNKTELTKIRAKLEMRGLTCVPVKLYRNERNLWKLEFAIVSGKKNWDKRDDIKKRDLDRQVKREMVHN